MLTLLSWATGGLLILITVSIHYETMLTVSDRVVPWTRRHFRGRRAMMLIILTLMLGHIAEMWVWALAYAGALAWPDMGSLGHVVKPTFDDILYFSSVGYSSIGDNSLAPTGPLRALFACETLAGLLMIAWSASYTYLKMEQIWKEERGH